MKKVILTGLALLCALPAMATTRFVSQSGGSVSCGTDGTQSTISAATFNGITNAPDDVNKLCGTFTGGLSANMLIPQGSGSSGHPVTILFESGANLTSPAWSGTGAIELFGVNWYVIDGGTNGIIQNTANGSGLANEVNSKGIYMASANHITVQNLTVANICQHTLGTDLTGCQTSGTTDACIKVNDNGSNSTFITITQNVIHDCYAGVDLFWNNGDTDFVATGNAVSRTNWGMTAGGTGTLTRLTISNNDITCVVAAPCNWEINTGDFHHNGMIIDPGTGALANNFVVSNNYIHDVNPCTGFVFLDPSGSGDTPGVQIYNNIGFTTAGQSGPGNAFWQAGIGVSNAVIVNNTAVGPGSQAISAQVTPTIKNNITSSMQYGELLNAGFSGVSSDYNDFYNLSQGFFCGSTFAGSLAAWQSTCSLDAHSINTNPNLNASFFPNVGSPVIGGGTNLTSLGIAGLNQDAPQFFGPGWSCGTGCTARPSVGAWPIGAYGSTGGSSTTPTTPSVIVPFTIAIIVPPPPPVPIPAIKVTLPATIPAATVGTSYSLNIAAVNCGKLGVSACNCTASGLPKGLVLSSVTGGCLVSGIIPVGAYTTSQNVNVSLTVQ